ncbi:MAG: branched-chain amino acid ABC transporter permease [Nitrososphaerota archaeon]
MRKTATVLAASALLAVLASVPFYSTLYVVSLLFFLFTFVGLAIAYDIFGGFAGYYNLGFGAFFAIGAYTFPILSLGRLGFQLHPILAFLAAPVVSGVAAFLLSYPFLRLRGAYFAVATFGLIPLMYNLARNLSMITGGASGIQIVVTEFFGMLPGFYIAMGITVMTSVVHYLIKRSRLWLALNSIREDEDVASEYGVDAFAVKRQVFVVSSIFAGFLGANFGFGLGVVSPDGVLNLEIALAPLIMTIFGGPASLLGAILGGSLITLIQEFLWLNIPFFHLATYGLIILLVAIFAPQGVVNLRVRPRIPKTSPRMD